MGRLTTHVLDTARGRPAEAVPVLLRRLDAEGEVVARGRTNADGRLDRPLIEGEAFTPGRYELEFDAGAYFRTSGVALPDPPFLDAVVIRFGISEDAHYHVPLLLSPYGYTTYRGS